MITITGIGDHLRPEWPITITGTRTLMFGIGIISRLSFGWIADRIGPAPALLISSSLQAASLLA